MSASVVGPGRTDGTGVADERAAEETYRRVLHRDDAHRLPVAHGRGRPSRGGRGRNGDELIGRVKLDRYSDLVNGTEFYIGHRYCDEAGLVVFSWTTEIACTFYQGTRHHEHCDHVAIRRTLRRDAGKIVACDDEPIIGGTAGFTGPGLRVAGSRRRALPSPRASTEPPVPAIGGPTRSTPEPVRPRADNASRFPERRPASSPTSGSAPVVLRAEAAVRAAMASPRRRHLSSVLATLQSDQYRIVTAAPDASSIVQGPPGTGKTIVAAHRAAFLVDDDEGKRFRACRRVLVVGPTRQYIEHVHPAIAELVADVRTVRTASLDTIMLYLRGIDVPVDDTLAEEKGDVDPDILVLAERAEQMLRETGQLPESIAHADAVERIYESLRVNDVAGQPIVSVLAWELYLSQLPAFGSAVAARRLLGVLAACAVAVRGVVVGRYQHIVVDEAQDVTGLEWALLRRLSAGGWTLLGDGAQRRSDYSCPTWADVRDAIEVPTAGLETLTVGYRTTMQIMSYASRLLPVAERSMQSLQRDGSRPRQVRCTSRTLPVNVVREAEDLLEAHPNGTVAIIGMRPSDITVALRNRGFLADSRHPDRVRKAGREIRVLHPHQARGLEFDGVVVVEPGAFPPRQDRHGLLYTSLTRANRALTVVHSKGLPSELCGRGTVR